MNLSSEVLHELTNQSFSVVPAQTVPVLQASRQRLRCGIGTSQVQPHRYVQALWHGDNFELMSTCGNSVPQEERAAFVAFQAKER